LAIDFTITAVSNGKRIVPQRILVDQDLTKYKDVHEYRFVMKQSNIMTLAQTDAMVDMQAPPQPNNRPSPSANDRLFPVAYLHTHVVELYLDGKEVKTTFETFRDMGEIMCGEAKNLAEAQEESFFKQGDEIATPPSGETDGEKGTRTNSKASAQN
jgi:hypothetical protein